VKLREKTLLTISFVFLTTFIALLIISRSILLKGFVNLEEKDVKNQIDRVISTAGMDLSNFSGSNKDYSSWDETYEYVQDKNDKYTRVALTNDSFRSLKMNMFIMIDSNGMVVYEKAFDYRKDKEIPVPKDIIQHIGKNSPLFEQVRENKSVEGFVTLKEGIMIVVSRAILRSNGEGPFRGVLITGRYLDEEQQEQFRRVTNISFGLKNINEKDMPSYKEMEYAVGGSVVKPASSERVTGQTILKDIYDKPAVLLTVNLPRDIYKQGMMSIKYITIFILIIGIVFIIVVLNILDKLIIRRILKLNYTVNKITEEKDTKLRVDVNGDDEIGNLSEGVNSMLNVIEVYIDKLRASEEKYKRSNEKLKELDKLKTDFLSTVSHELRTPLTSILGFCKIMKKKLENVILPTAYIKDEKVLKATNQVLGNIDIVISESERLTAIINDVLDITKMEEGKVEWKREKVKIDEVINDAINATYPLFEVKKIDVTKDIDEALPYALGDKDKIVQVVINLLSNAVKFTEKGEITCKARVENNEIIVSVIDTGIGIREEDLKSVFEKFKQVGDALTNKPKGTGLGLPICKNIIEHHGGRIWVESKINEGSKFSFSLPVER